MTPQPWMIDGPGGPLAGRCYPGQPGGRAVVFLGALAAPQRYLADLAGWLAARGDSVLTVDYRGVGDSAARGRPETNLDDWAEDARAALRAARERLAPSRLLVVGHSIGGMLLGHAGLAPEEAPDAALLIAATHGVPRHYGRGKPRLRLELAYRVLPVLARGGRLPASPLLLGASVPRDVLRHWVRWGREARFARWDGTDSGPAFAAYRGPLLGVSLADDDYAPGPAVDALLRRFPAAPGWGTSGS